MRDARLKAFTRRDAVVAFAASTATLAGRGRSALAKSPPAAAGKYMYAVFANVHWTR